MKIKRNYEDFEGRNKFYCNGLIIMSNSNCAFLITFISIIFTSTLFFYHDARYFCDNSFFAIPIVGGWLFMFVIVMLLWTSFSDPAPVIVPSEPGPPVYVPPQRQLDVTIKGKEFLFKYCFICKIFRPPRTTHCSICDNCVECFDHHCKMVGNCIGKRNYRYFYLFVVSLFFLCIYVFVGAVTHLVLRCIEMKSFFEALNENPTSAIVTFICFITFWPIAALAGFHSYSITGKMVSSRGENPYYAGSVFNNCFKVICGPAYPSLIRRRETVSAPLVSTSYGAIQLPANDTSKSPNLPLPTSC
ncbi:palmitoyltransferase ZDHHC14 isoform X2 [Hydra vulgaris]|uniref:palmitoyltransferase ZDHHC14 isoform X2 n=1 Tax=Hydra vulgaris TaxID=6087 RepID=UPI0032E9CA75